MNPTIETNSLNWDWNHVVEFNDEKIEPDLLNRNKYAKHIYEISSIRGKDKPFTLNLNAQWGAGKTHFVKMLAATIKDNHPVIYIDAWKQDYSNDPLIAIFSSIIDQLRKQSKKFISISNKLEKKLTILLSDVAPALANSVTKLATSSEILGQSAQKVTEHLIKIHNEKNDAIANVKKDISEWVALIKQKDATDKDLPIYIFIDELDRCRPSYAIKLLETVKHIFDVKGLVFIISTDTNQLQHSIKVIYGNGFDATHYLSRFFDRRFVLPSPSVFDLLWVRTPESILNNFNEFKKLLHPQPSEVDGFISAYSSIIEGLDISLRESLKIYDKACDIILIHNSPIDHVLLFILISLNEKYPEIYDRIKSKDTVSDQYSDRLSSKIKLEMNLSRTVTGVVRFSDYGLSTLTNSYNIVNEQYSIEEYVNESLYVINCESPITKGNDDYGIHWTNGGISSEVNLRNRLMVTWAAQKESSNNIRTSEYYDLVELSTLL